MGPNSDPSLREFFAKMRAEGGVVVQGLSQSISPVSNDLPLPRV